MLPWDDDSLQPREEGGTNLSVKGMIKGRKEAQGFLTALAGRLQQLPHLTRTAGHDPGAHTDAAGPCHDSGSQVSHPHTRQSSSATKEKMSPESEES